MTGVRTVGDRDFADVVLGSGVPVVVAFHAEGSASCRRLGPVLDELAKDLPSVVVTRLDALANPLTVTAYEVTGLPTYVVFDRGEPVLTIVGARPRRVLRDLLVTATGTQPA